MKWRHAEVVDVRYGKAGTEVYVSTVPLYCTAGGGAKEALFRLPFYLSLRPRRIAGQASASLSTIRGKRL